MADASGQRSVPARSREQRLAALALANTVRLGRAELKRALRERRVPIGEVIACPPEEAARAKVSELLLAVPKFGRARVARLLRQCGISEAKTVGGLSARQRAELVRRLAGEAGAVGDPGGG